MAKVFRETVIEYDGEHYTFSPSNRFLRRLDAGLAPQTHMSVIALMQDAAQKSQLDPMAAARFPFSSFAYIIAEMVQEGGGDVGEDEVYADVMDDLTNNGGKGLPGLIEAVADCVAPPDRTVGNSPAPQKGAKRKKKPSQK